MLIGNTGVWFAFFHCSFVVLVKVEFVLGLLDQEGGNILSSPDACFGQNVAAWEIFQSKTHQEIDLFCLGRKTGIKCPLLIYFYFFTVVITQLNHLADLLRFQLSLWMTH